MTNINFKNTLKLQKIIYLSSPISSQYGGGEKFLDNFTTSISEFNPECKHIFIGSSKAVYDLFKFKNSNNSNNSNNYDATLTEGWNGCGFEPVSIKNLLLFPISVLLGIKQVFRFWDTFRSADLIVSPTSHCETFFVIPLIKLLLGKPALFMVHSSSVPKIFKLFPINFLLSLCWGKSAVTFVSNSQKQLWNSTGCQSNGGIVIYNGVKAYDYKSYQPKDVDTTITVGFLARLHPEKACDVLIKSLQFVESKQPIRVLIGGDGSEKQKLQNLIYSLKTEFKLPSNITVEFVGFVVDTKSFYEKLDLFVFPSYQEGFSLVLLEAFERGLPVVTSDIAPFIEAKKFMNEQEQKLIFRVGDYQDLATKINFFLSNQEVYMDLEYKQSLHNLIKESFSVDVMMRRYLEVI